MEAISNESAPFARRSVSLRMYPHALAPTQLLDELQLQASLAASVGFDGVLLSERHGGAWNQIPNPLQVAGWVLGAMSTGWAAPCPMILPFRQSAVVAEELAWLGARFPGRVGAGFGSGGNAPDFELVGVPFDQRGALFDRKLREVVAILRGTAQGEHQGDGAVALAVRNALPLVSAAMTPSAARRAGSLGVGMIGSSLLSLPKTTGLLDAYRGAGGSGPHVVICRTWLGDPPVELMEKQFAEYRASSSSAPPVAATDGLFSDTDADALAERLMSFVTLVDADALNIRVHVAGLSPQLAREQIERIGREVLPKLRTRWAAFPE